MHLPGRLAASTLGDLLGALYRGSTTGHLELTEVTGSMRGYVAGRKHRIHLFKGLVAGVETGLPARPLGEILHERGYIGADVLVALMRHVAWRDKRPTGQILVEEGLASPRIVDAGLRAQTRRRLEPLFDLVDATVTFHTAKPLSDAARRLGLVGVDDFLVGRPRARDRGQDAYAWAAPSAAGRSEGQEERRVSPNRPWTSAGPRGNTKAGPESPPRGAPRVTEETPPASRITVIDPTRARALRTLGLAGDADEPAIRKAFRRLAVELHPDKFATAPAEKRAKTSALFAEVSAAYHLLVA